MKRLFVPLFVLAAGCAVDTNLDTDVAEVLRDDGCPDWRNCDLGNGGGVYTQEHGYAGIGPNGFLITHFINNGSSVSLSGRRYNPSTSAFQVDGGSVQGAYYHGTYYSVLSVHEDLTKPTWRLSDGVNPPFDVSGSQIVTKSSPYLQGLQLVVGLSDGSDNKQYTIAFSDYVSESMTSVTGNVATVDKTNVVWKLTSSTMLFQEYCHLAGTAGGDTAVFQEGFAVNALTADFAANSAFVTLSCREGGPPTARLWGYTYGTTTTFRFQAALHMKRASYCGDFRYFTKVGTHIKAYDPVGKQHNIGTATYQNIEAVWTKDGAKCVNLGDKLRHDGQDPAVGWPNPTDPPFDGKCRDLSGNVLYEIPLCTQADMTGALLASEASP